MTNVNPHPKDCPTCAKRRQHKTNPEPIDWDAVKALSAFLPGAPVPLIVDYTISAEDFRHSPSDETLERFLELAEQLNQFRSDPSEI